MPKCRAVNGAWPHPSMARKLGALACRHGQPFTARAGAVNLASASLQGVCAASNWKTRAK